MKFFTKNNLTAIISGYIIGILVLLLTFYFWQSTSPLPGRQIIFFGSRLLIPTEKIISFFCISFNSASCQQPGSVIYILLDWVRLASMFIGMGTQYAIIFLTFNSLFGFFKRKTTKTNQTLD